MAITKELKMASGVVECNYKNWLSKRWEWFSYASIKVCNVWMLFAEQEKIIKFINQGPTDLLIPKNWYLLVWYHMYGSQVSSFDSVNWIQVPAKNLKLCEV